MPLVHVVGLGLCQPPHLSQSAQVALAKAQKVYGSSRQLQSMAASLSPACEQVELPSLKVLATQLRDCMSANQPVVVLASGDPLWFGIGHYIARHFSDQVAAGTVQFHSNTSSIQGICARTGVSLQDTYVVSLHGRPLVSIRPHLTTNARLILLTDKHSQPHHLAQECALAGLHHATIHVVERMGYDDERYRKFTVTALLQAHEPLTFDPLHVSLIDATSQSEKTLISASVYPSFPGIPDEGFVTDGDTGKGLLTKREIRLCVLSLLQPAANDIGWDVGAGCGGIAVEWALWNPYGQVHAIEPHERRLRCLHANREKFGVIKNLTTHAAPAPAALTDLPTPNKVFVGGSGGALEAILAKAWAALAPGGRLVMSAVTEQTKAAALDFAKTIDLPPAEILQVAISRGQPLAGQDVLRPGLPVNLYAWHKPYATKAQQTLGSTP